MTTDSTVRAPAAALLADMAWLRRLTRRLTNDSDTAADLEQEVALAALSRPATPGGRAWMATVARNLAALVRRRRARELARLRRLAMPDSSAPTADLVAAAELHRRAVAAVLALPATYRDVVLLRFLQGLPPEAVAARLALPLETVRTRQRRALATLRAQLLRNGSDDSRAFAFPWWSFAFMKAKHVLGATAILVLLVLGSSPLWLPEGAAHPPTATNATAADTTPAPDVAPPAKTPEAVERQPATTPELADPPAADPQTAAIVVHVAWKDDRQPAAAAVVMCRHQDGPGTMQATDANGTVRFEDLEPGDYTVCDSGLRSRRVAVAAGKTVEIELQVERGLTVHGIVVDVAGAPIADAEIFIRRTTVIPSWPFPAGRSDRQGRFTIQGASREYVIGARQEHWGTTPCQMLQPAAGAAECEVELRFGEGGSTGITGRVLDPDGRPVAGAWVEIAHRVVTQVGAEVLVTKDLPEVCGTDGTGQFQARFLRPGTNFLYVYRRGFAPHRREIELTPHQVAILDVRLVAGASLSGTVQAAGKRSALGALVRIEGLQLPQKRSQYIGPKGGFQFEDLPAGELEVVVTMRERARVTHRVTIVGTEAASLDIVLTDEGTLRGRIVDAAGKPLVGWYVERPDTNRFARTDGDGKFALPECEPEGNTLLIRPQSGVTPVRMRVEGVAALPGEQVFVVAADTEPSATVRGQCIDREGKPLPDVAIQVFQGKLCVHRGTKSAGDGTFTIGPLPPGKYVARPFHADGVFEAVQLELQPHEVRDLPPMQLPGPKAQR